MKRTLFPALAALALLTGGCNVHWTVVQDNFPNFHLIERRANFQDQQIGNAVQTDQLARPYAQALSDNLDLIRHLAWEYQNGTEGQPQDLSAPQTRFLGILLNDNQSAINDALTRQSQWANAFQGGWNYDFSYQPDRLLYIAVLQHQLVEQEAMVEDALSNGSLSPSQVADLRSRIQVVREAEWDDYNQNGSLDLNRDQMEELSQMVDDNYRYLRFRAQYSDRRWSGDHFDSWGQYKKDFAVTPSNLPAISTTNNKYWNGRTTRVQNPPNTIPAQSTAPSKLPPPSNSGIFSWALHPTPTVTPMPQVPAPTSIPKAFYPTATSWPQAPPPAPTSTQPPQPPAQDQEKPWKDQGDHRPNGGGPGNSGAQTGDQVPGPGAKTAPPTGQPNEPKLNRASNNNSPTIGPALISPDALNQRFQALNDRIGKDHEDRGMNGRDRNQLNQKRNYFRQSLNKALQQNHRKGLTQDQVNQLTKILNDLEKSIPTDQGQ